MLALSRPSIQGILQPDSNLLGANFPMPKRKRASSEGLCQKVPLFLITIIPQKRNLGIRRRSARRTPYYFARTTGTLQSSVHLLQSDKPNPLGKS